MLDLKRLSKNELFEKLSSKIGKAVLFIGIGYDIVGDWLLVGCRNDKIELVK